MQQIFLRFVMVILCAATLYRIFFHLALQPVQRWDELTNIAVVTDSLSRESFPVLYLDNNPFFEKSPLWYMTTAAVVTVTNPSLFSMRLISALSGIGVIILTVFLAWRWWGTLGGITAWIVLLGSNQLFITNAGGYFSTHTFRSADVDALQIFFIVAAFAACTRIASNSLMSGIAGIATGFALLTKGPLGIIPLVASTVLFARSNKVSRHNFLTAWIIFFFTAIPWYLFMTIRFGFPFLSAHFGYHIIGRAFFAIEGHTIPPWYYFQLLRNHEVFFSWELLAGSLVWVMTQKLYRNLKVLYVLVLTIVFFIIPTFMHTRLAWYILPFYPMASLIIGATIADVGKRFGTVAKLSHAR